MNKQEFLNELQKRLFSLEQSDIDKYKDYYSEMIDDRIEDGLSEEEAVFDLGEIENIISQILSDCPRRKAVETTNIETKSKKLSSGWIILITVLTAPFWFPFVTSVISVAFSLIIAAFAVIIALYAIVFAFFVFGIISMAACAVELFAFNVIEFAICLGLGLVFLGFSILLFFGTNWLLKNIFKLIKFLCRKTKEFFKERRVFA